MAAHLPVLPAPSAGCSLLAALLVTCGVAIPSPTSAATWYVAPGGDNGSAGSAAAPWETLQHAADMVAAGDTVMVAAGDYVGFDLRTSGTAGAWIRFLASPGARIVTRNPVTPDGDYHLKAGSPALDVGTPTGAPADDIDGDSRPSGPGVDIGADERFVPPPCTAPATLTLSDDTVTGPELHEACDEITAGPAYTVAGGGDLTLRTRGRVVFASGFAILAGDRLAVAIDPSTGAP